jgi:hypothetical protein
MTALLAPAGADPVEIVAGLREWAAGFSADEAAVELLAAIAVEVPAVLDVASSFGSPCWNGALGRGCGALTVPPWRRSSRSRLGCVRWSWWRLR